MQFWLSFTFVVFCIHAQVSLAQVNQVVCYFQSWSIYRPGIGYFQLSDIDGNLCTHFIYAYAAINSNAEVIVEDSYVDQELGGYSQFNGLRDQFPNLKTLISIGGEDSPSETFADLKHDLGYAVDEMGFSSGVGIHVLQCSSQQVLHHYLREISRSCFN